MRLNKLPLLLAIAASPLWLTACSNPDTTSTTTEAPTTAAPTGEPGKADDAPVAGLSPDAVATAEEATPAATPAPATSEVAAGEAAASGDPTAAAAEGDTRQRIERLLGNPDPYEQVFNDLQRGIAAGDRVAVGKLMRYPLRATIGGNNKQIANAEAFQREYTDIVTPALAQLIAEQRFDTLFVNGQGVMLGQGEVWITGVCKDKACTQSDVKVNNIGQ